MARGGDHEEWLDEQVPDWGQLDDEGLGERVIQYAESAEFPQLFEETTGRDQHHDASHQHGQPRQSANERLNSSQFDAETQAILQRARELTRERQKKQAEADDSESQED